MLDTLARNILQLQLPIGYLDIYIQCIYCKFFSYLYGNWFYSGNRHAM